MKLQQLRDEIFSQVDGLDAEAISHQFSSNLGPRLEELFKDLFATYDKNSSVMKRKLKGFEEIFMDECGILVNVSEDREHFGHFVIRPLLNENHIFNTDEFQKIMVKDMNRDMHTKVKVFKGDVDLKNAKLSGDFSKIEHEMNLSIEQMVYDKFGVKEAVAVTLHELGHLFTYYEYLMFATSANYLMQNFAEELFEIKDEKTRLRLCHETNFNGMKIINTELVANAQSEDAMKVVLFSDIIEQNKSNLGINLHDMVGYERLSDQFVTRMGYGRYLVTGLDKLEDSWNGGVSKKNHVTPWPVLVIVTLTSPFWAPAFLALSGLLLAVIDFQAKTYDDPKKRLQLVKKEMIGRAKIAEGNEKKEILDSLKIVESIINEYDDKQGAFEWLQSRFGPSGRGAYRSITTQKLLEEFANSDLHLAAMRLENM